MEFANGAIRLEIGPAARLLINAPQKRNAMSQAMWQGLSEACAVIAADYKIRVVTVTGAEGHFCAGADLAEFEEIYANEAAIERSNAVIRAAQFHLRNLPQPVLAQIEGACVGGGCGIALACDLRFAARGAKFAITPSKLGLAYPPEDSAQLVEKIGIARAKDLLLSARLIGAEEALSYGLVEFLTETPQQVADYAAKLLELSPASLRATKAILNGLGAPDAARCDSLHPIFAATFSGPDAREGRAAFLQKRKPHFTG